MGFNSGFKGLIHIVFITAVPTKDDRGNNATSGRVAYVARPRDFVETLNQQQCPTGWESPKNVKACFLATHPLQQGNVIAPARDTPPDVLPLYVHTQSKTAMKVLVLQISTAFSAVSKSDYTIRSLCEVGGGRTCAKGVWPYNTE